MKYIERAGTVLSLAAIFGCAKTITGPVPEVTAVAPALVCSAQLDFTLTVTGAKFSPLPTGLLTDAPGVALPEVSLAIPGESTFTPLSGLKFADTQTLTAVLAKDTVAPGVYDVRVQNPNGLSGALAGALTVVPPPDLVTIDPIEVFNNVSTTLTLTGTGFRTGAAPAVTFTPAGGGGGGAAVDATGEAVVSETSVTAAVPAGIAAGTYDVTVTNPEGCSDTLVAALTVKQPLLIDLTAVTPAFGWIGSRTTLQITASNANGHGLQPVPEVFLLVDNGSTVTEVPLIREAFIATGTTSQPSIASAVVPSASEPRGAGIVVGGPYDLKVVNPGDGATGIIPGAFEVLADPPPVITSVAPEQGDTQSATPLTITGNDFKDPATTQNPRIARVLLLTTNLAAGAACSSPQCFECASPVRTGTGAGTTIACSAPSNTMGAGAYVVRVEHLDDGSFGNFASFAVTNPSGNLGSTTASMPALGVPRMAHGAAFARDDLGNRFVYAVGGRSGSAAANALDTVEVLPLPLFANPTGWAALPVKLPKKLDGLSLVAHGQYLFAAGGRDETGAASDKVYRARVLGSDSAPEIGAPTAGTGGSLAAGVYYYKVSAVMGAGTDNENGETLPSDEESVRVAASGKATLAWQAVTGADKYRIYRSELADQIANTEVFVKEDTAANLCTGSDCAFADAGTVTVDAAKKPRPTGSTGEWMAMSTLVEARYDAAAAIAKSPDGTQHLFLLGGRDGTDAVRDTVYVAALAETAGVPAPGSFAAAGAMPVKRAEFTAVTLSAATAPALANKNTNQYLVVSNGITETGATNTQIQSAKVENGGLLAGGWSLRDSGAQYARFGHVAVLTNNYYFTIGGRDTGVLNKGQTAVVTCTGACDPPPLAIQGGDSGITLSAARYRGALIYDSAFFYFIGGSTNGTAPIASVERGSYQ